MQNLAWINGHVCKLSEAVVSLEDRGYLFGDGVYEVIRVYNGIPFYLDSHLERLQRSAAAIRLAVPHSFEEMKKIALGLIAEGGGRECYIYIQLTRGINRREHIFPGEVNPSLALYVQELPANTGKGEVKPISCITLPDERWLNCYIKSVNLLPNVLAKQSAAEAGASEAILYRPGGVVTEGAVSNVFAVIEGEVRTHPESKLILSGITRRIVLDIIAGQDIACKEEAFTLNELKGASEVLLTSTVMELRPVGIIDGEAVGDGSVGPVSRSLISHYKNAIFKHCDC